MKKTFLTFLIILGMLGTGSARAQEEPPPCYSFGTPGSVQSGEVCFSAEITETSTAPQTIPPTDIATIAPTLTTSPTVTGTSIATAIPNNPLLLDWIVGDEIGVIADTTAKKGEFHNMVVFLNSATGDGVDKYPMNQWATVDLSGYVPENTKAVFLSGMLIITHGSVAETCDLHTYFRSGNSVTDTQYVGQTVEAHIGGGQRSNHSVWVPLDDGKFQFKWNSSTYPNTYPTHRSYGVNMRLNAWLR